MLPDPSLPTPLVLFDGDCALCSAAVRWLLRMDRKGLLYFAPIESDVGRRLKMHYDLGPVDSLMLIQDQGPSIRSTAVMEICALLPLPWRWLYGLRCVPKGIRDLVYDGIAAIRKRGVLRKNRCRLPDPEYSHRFIR